MTVLLAKHMKAHKIAQTLPKAAQRLPAKKRQDTPVKEARRPSAKKPKSVPVKEANLPSAKEPKSVPVKEARRPSAKEPKSTPAKEAQPPSAKEPKNVPVKEARRPSAKEPKSAPAKEAQPPSAKKPLQPSPGYIARRPLAKNTAFETPYYVIDSNRRGSAVMITAGVHGSERAGMLAAKSLVGSLQKRKERICNGRLIIVPVANQIAVKRRTRGVPDLNRTFPKPGSPKARHPLSAALFQLARQNKPAWYIDLHEANGLSKENPKSLGQTLIINPQSQALPAAKRIVNRINRSIAAKKRHFTIVQRELPGSGRSAASHFLRAKAVTVETGIGLPIKDRIRYQLSIMRSLLKEAGVTNAPKTRD